MKQKDKKSKRALFPCFFYNVLPQVWLSSFEWCVHKLCCVDQNPNINLIQPYLKINLLASFFFCGSPCHWSHKKKWNEGIAPFPCLACCCIQKQDIYLAFSFLQRKQRLSQTRKWSMVWNEVTNYANLHFFKWFCCLVVFQISCPSYNLKHSWQIWVWTKSKFFFRHSAQFHKKISLWQKTFWGVIGTLSNMSYIIWLVLSQCQGSSLSNV